MDLSLRPKADFATDTVVRSRWGRIGSGLVLVGCLAAAVVTLVQGGPVALLRALPLLVLLGLLSGLLWGLPHVVVSRDVVVLANPLRTTRIGLAAVERADARFGLSVEAAGRRHHAWAAPARSSMRHRDNHPSALAGQVGGGEFDLDAFEAAALVNNRVEAHSSTDATITRQWEWPRIVTLASVLAACAIQVLA